MFYPFKRQRIGELMGERIGWRCRSTRSSLNPFRPFPFLNKRREKNQPDEKHARQITGKEKGKMFWIWRDNLHFKLSNKSVRELCWGGAIETTGTVVSKLRTSDLNVFYWRQWKKRAGMTIKSKINKTGKEQERKRKEKMAVTWLSTICAHRVAVTL